MANEWDADLDLSPEQARGLVERHFPDLAPARLELLGQGWDNTAYVVNGALVFRFPRRSAFAGLLRAEVEILPRLAPHLPLPVSCPTLSAEGGEEFPFLFAGYPLIPGTTACRLSWSEAQREACAAPLGHFLAALHGIPVSDADLARGPGDRMEKANLPRRVAMVRERLAGLTGRGGPVPLPEVVRAMEALQETPPWGRRPCWVHGDFYLRHLIADEARRLQGVIDWGDVHLGDPALDLSIAFTFLPAAARETFRAAYGPIDADTWERSRFRALFYGAVLYHYGVEARDEAIRAAGEYALGEAADGSAW